MVGHQVGAGAQICVEDEQVGSLVRLIPDKMSVAYTHASGPRWIDRHTNGVAQTKALPILLKSGMHRAQNVTQGLASRLPSISAAASDRLIPC